MVVEEAYHSSIPLFQYSSWGEARSFAHYRIKTGSTSMSRFTPFLSIEHPFRKLILVNRWSNWGSSLLRASATGIFLSFWRKRCAWAKISILFRTLFQKDCPIFPSLLPSLRPFSLFPPTWNWWIVRREDIKGFSELNLFLIEAKIVMIFCLRYYNGLG